VSLSLKTREQGMPDARCTRGPVCKGQKENRTRAYRAAEALRHSLRNGFTAYNALSPENRALLSPSPHGIWHVSPVGLSAPLQDLTPTTEASGPHDFAVRFCSDVSASRDRSRALKPALRSHRAHEAAASTASYPNVRDDGQRPFPGDRMAGVVKVICPTAKAKFCPSG
jgi:hypothetical protein